MVIIMEEYLKIIEELKNIKNDLRDLPARRLKLIDLLIQKYERLNLEEEALNPLGKYKLIEDVDNPDYEKYAGRYGKSVKEWKEPVQQELDLEEEDKKAEEEKDLKRAFPEADLGLE